MFAEIALIATTATTAATALHAARLSRRLHTDELTGLGNRAALARAARRGRGTVGLLLADLDGFKAINDTYGHDFGNRVLAAVAARLADAAQPGELAARLHGDEFALWLGPVADPARAELRREQVAAALAAPLWVDGHRLTAAGSVGLALAPARAPLAALLAAADAHMYQVKAARRAGLAVLPTAPRRTRDQQPPRTAA